MSHGKAVSCAVYDAHDATATMIFLRGSGPSDLALGRLEARFFAEHGFRVLLPDYLSATPTAEPTAANYRRWAQVVEDIVADLRSRPFRGKENCPCRAGPGGLCRPPCRLPEAGRRSHRRMVRPSPQRIFLPGAEPASAPHPSWRAGQAGPDRQRPPAGPSLRAQRLHLRSRNLSRRGPRLQHPAPWTPPTSAP